MGTRYREVCEASNATAGMSLINFLLLNDEPDDDVGELDPAPAATDKAVSRRGDLKAHHRVLQADDPRPAELRTFDAVRRTKE
jgi:hypothetical protein